MVVPRPALIRFEADDCSLGCTKPGVRRKSLYHHSIEAELVGYSAETSSDRPEPENESSPHADISFS